ncbi:MAG: RNA polymerase sigma-70 factor [Chitinophagaceae bacterium]|nr:RNA polymerase sigma-70 factor [Chitinophagaceae bacterium]
MHYPKLQNEQELQRRLAGGDTTAFDNLYNYYWESLGSFILRYVKVPELAEDLSQEVFSKIWEAREMMSQVDSFRGYLFTTARNHTLNFLNRATKINAAKGLMLQHMPKPVALPDDDLIMRDYKQWLQNILQEMTPQMRQVFQLIRQEYKTYDEVAVLLGISRNTVKKHMVGSMKIIRGRLDDELGLSLSLSLLLFITLR